MKALLLLLLVLLAAPLIAEDDAEAAAEAVEVAPPPPDHHALRLAEIRALPLEGEKLELMTGEGPTFALYLANSSSRHRGAVVLLHDHHHHLIDAPLEGLRLGLSQHGWDTLAVQLPRRKVDEERLDWLERSKDHINAALGYLEGRDSGSVALIGHGSGALLAVDWLFNTSRDRVLGLVAISMDGSADPEPRLDAPRQMGQVNVPVLDVYAMHDRPIVRHTAERRAREAQRTRRNDNSDERVRYRDIAPGYSPRRGDRVHYRQLQIPGVDHTYQPNEALLLRAVRGWLQRHAKPQ